MKLKLALIFSLYSVPFVFSQTDSSKDHLNDVVQIWGTVTQVLPKGVILQCAFTEGDNKEAWRGFVFLIGHPKQGNLAEGDKVSEARSQRVGNYRDGSSVIRAYRFLDSRYPQ